MATMFAVERRACKPLRPDERRTTRDRRFQAVIRSRNRLQPGHAARGVSAQVEALRRGLAARAPVPPRAGALVGGAVLAVSTIAFFRVPLLPAIGDDLRLAPTTLSLVTTMFAVGRLLSDLPAGRLADRLPPAVALVSSAAGVGIGSLVFAVAHSAGVLLIGAVVLGIASALSNTTGMTFFSVNAVAARRGQSMALFSAALLGGQSLGPAVAGVLVGLGSWRTVEAIAAALALVVTVALLRGRDVPPGGGAARGRGGASSAPIAARPGDMAVLYAVSFVSFFALGAMPQTFVGIIGADAFGLSTATIGLALGVGGACRFMGALTGGWVADRVSRKAALVPGLAVMAAGTALLAVRASPLVWLLAIVLLSLGSFGISVAATMLGDRTHPRSVGRRLGGFRLAGDIGLAGGPLVAGLLYAHVSPAAAVLTVAALLGAVAVAAAVRLEGGAAH
jgi:MFS family permease